MRSSSALMPFGYSLVELVFTTALITTLSAVAVPPLLANVDEARAVGATRYLSTRLQQVKMEAIARSTDVGVKFLQEERGYSFTTYVDGNGNGIRSADIQRGVDTPLRPAERLRDLFSGVDFGAGADVTAVDPQAAAPGDDPVRVGASNILTFTPMGTSSTGSLYVRSPGGAQYVVRIFGETGKTRMLRFDARQRKWKPL